MRALSWLLCIGISTLPIGCARTGAPAVPSAGPASANAGELPQAFRIVPFLELRGGTYGEEPLAGLVGDGKGDLFGVTTAGGKGCAPAGTFAAGCGVLYELVPQTGGGYSERIVYRFNPANGVHPLSPLAPSGSIAFGTTSAGGTYGFGSVYEIDTGTGTVRTLYSFKGGSDGATPIGPLYVDAQNDVFGTTAYGGGGSCQGGCGTAFELLAQSSYAESVIAAFKGGNDGWEPWTGLIASNGTLFGTTLYGGTGQCKGGCGTIFRLVPQHGGYARHLIHAIDGATEGAYIKSPLYEDSNGNLYVEAQNGGNTACVTNGGVKGALGCGVLLELVQHGNGTYTSTIVHAFAGGTDGAVPIGGLSASGSGLYGTTEYGGSSATCGGAAAGCGIAFAIDAGGYRIVRRFKASAGARALDPVVFPSASGGLNGAISAGGKYGYGAIFTFAPPAE